MIKAAIYARVSTTDQNAEQQLVELKRLAKSRGWEIMEEFIDNGISGKKDKSKRPALAAMMEAVSRRKVDLVAVWALDRLGRSLSDLLGILNEIEAAKVEFFCYQQNIDTSSAAGRLLFQLVGAFAEFERELIVSRVRAGISRAKAAGKHCGRPKKDDPKLKAKILELRAGGAGLIKIGKTLGVSTGLVQRIVAEAV